MIYNKSGASPELVSRPLIHHRIRKQQPSLFAPAAMLLVLFLTVLLSGSPRPATSSSSSPHDNVTDLSALLAFKSNLADPYNVLSDSWSTATSFCDWTGVSCSQQRQRVTSLSLFNLSLGGSISPHIGNLSFLVSLDLSNNSLNGQLPDTLGRLPRLRSLDVSFNDLSGALPSAVFDNLSSLEEIGISHNTLSGQIPASLARCRDLRVLSLEHNRFTGSIPTELGELSKLHTVNLEANNLTGTIPPSLGSLKQLEVLRLAQNDLVESIPQELGHLPNLQVLNLESNGLTGGIPGTIFNISSLRELSLATNMFSGQIPAAEDLKLPRLELLKLQDNQFSGPIPSSLGSLPELRYLNLAYNNLTGTIPPSLGNLTQLLTLVIQLTHIQGEIPSELGNLANLQKLNLAGNGLTGEVPRALYNMSSLQVLGLTQNYLSGQMPKDAGHRLPNLQKLYLNVNKLSGEIPSSLGNASMLDYLELSYNNFTGSVPAAFGDLQRLEYLNVHTNELSGGLDFLTPFTRCRELKTLNFMRNDFRGALPDSVGNLSTKLMYFTAEANHIQGKIPEGLSNLSSLIALVLKDNEFTGTIPPAITRLESLQKLYLENNQLEGSIPNEIYRLKNLVGLYLYRNKLSGSIPDSIGNISRLEELSAYENKLTSELPSGIWGLKQLLTLDLAGNSFNGILPADVGNLNNLNKMDLSGNEFSGKIPSTLGALQIITYINLARNHLSGPLPPTLGNLLNLDSLDLSSNALSGTIPKSLAELRDLTHLNLSFNRLEGEIPNLGAFKNLTTTSFMHNLALCGARRLGVPTCATDVASSRTRSRTDVLKYILPPIASLVLLVALVYLVFTYRKKKKVPSPTDPLISEGHRMITHQELINATEGFSEANLIGMGSFGSVYKGKLSDGTLAAIKVLNLQLGKAWQSFDAECQVMRAVRHRNIVKIISSCSNLDFRALVLQFMPNGSLEKWLYSHNYYLSLLQRINVMIDVASALEYLHHDSSDPVVHRDLKPSNILLDEGMVAHVSDFGIAKMLTTDHSMTATGTPGTFGYMAPEYGMTGSASTKSDVYSYGILLLETFTRRKPTDAMFTGESNLRQWVTAAFPSTIMEVVDDNLLRDRGESISTSHGNERWGGREDFSDGHRARCLFLVMELGLNCSRESPKERPNMKDVAVRVKMIKTQLLSNGNGVSQ